MVSFNFLFRFPDDQACWAFLEQMLWPKGPVCPKCDSVGNAAPWSPRSHRWQCRQCGAQFHVVQETALVGSHVTMHRWFSAIYLMTHSPRLSSVELGRQLGLRQKTAWSMQQRIQRLRIEDASLLRKIVEAAEDHRAGG